MRVLDRLGQRNVVVELVAVRQGPGDLIRRPNLDARSAVPASVLVDRDPLMIGVCDHVRAIREGHPAARSIEHRWRHPDDLHWRPGLVEHEVPGLEIAHRPPAARRRDGRVQGEGLPLQPRDEIDGKLHPFERLTQHELTGMEDERLVVLDVQQLRQVRLRVAHVDVGIPVVAEHPEAAIEVQVHGGGLQVARIVGIDADVAGLQLRPDVTVREDAHLRSALPGTGEPRSAKIRSTSRLRSARSGKLW